MTLKLRKRSKKTRKSQNDVAITPKKGSFRSKFTKKKLRTQRKKGESLIKFDPRIRCTFHNGLKQCIHKKVIGFDLCKQHLGDNYPKESFLINVPIVSCSKFDPTFHPFEFVKLALEGLSDVEIAKEFKVCKQTIKKWADTYKEFNEAYDIGKTIEEANYIRSGRNNLENPRFNTHLYKFLTGNRLGFTEKTESKNINMNLSGVLKVPGTMEDSEWEDADFTEGSDDA